MIVTPHQGGISIAAVMDLLVRPGQEIARVLKGEWPAGLLNPQAKERYRKRWGKGPTRYDYDSAGVNRSDCWFPNTLNYGE